MSYLPKDIIQVIAQQSGIPSLDDEIARRIAPDVEFRVRDLLSDAMKRMRASKRRVLLPADISSAIRAKNVDPLTTPDFTARERIGIDKPAFQTLGSATASAPPTVQSKNDRTKIASVRHYGDFIRVPGTTGGGLFYVEDPIVPLSSSLTVRVPPSMNRKITVASHWLAVEGVQPRIPQNPSAASLQSFANSNTLQESSMVAGASAVSASTSAGPGASGSVSTASAVAGGRNTPGRRGSRRSQAANPTSVSANGTASQGSASGPNAEDRIVIKARVGDVLSVEHRQWLEAVFKALADSVASSGKDAEEARTAALHAVATAEGVAPALPYLVRNIVETVQLSLSFFGQTMVANGASNPSMTVRLAQLQNALGLIRSVCSNQSLAVELYLHQLCPALISLVLSVNIPLATSQGSALRKEAAKVTGYVCRRYGGLYEALVGRVASTYVKALKECLSEKGELAAKAEDVREGMVVGALWGLRELGATAVYAVLLSTQEEIRLDDLAERWAGSDNVLWAIKECIAAYISAVEEGTGLAWAQVPDKTRDTIRRLVGVNIE
eukprot:ANDGO_03311.mRNA.1 Transcription initiation factor TFIID subunit 6